MAASELFSNYRQGVTWLIWYKTNVSHALASTWHWRKLTELSEAVYHTLTHFVFAEAINAIQKKRLAKNNIWSPPMHPWLLVYQIDVVATHWLHSKRKTQLSRQPLCAGNNSFSYDRKSVAKWAKQGDVKLAATRAFEKSHKAVSKTIQKSNICYVHDKCFAEIL